MHIEPTATATAVSSVAQVSTKASGMDAGAARVVAPSTGAQAGAPEGDWAEAEQSLRSIGETLEAFRISLNFSRDEETGAVVVRLMEEGTGEMIRQIPSEAALKLATAFGKLQGLIFNRRA